MLHDKVNAQTPQTDVRDLKSLTELGRLVKAAAHCISLGMRKQFFKVLRVYLICNCFCAMDGQ
jgi:hypothetical protein